MRRNVVRTVAPLFVVLAVPACGKKQPPAPAAQEQAAPAQAPTSTPRDDDDAARRAREAEEARLREELARLRATLEETVYLDYDRADIRADSKRVLDAKASILNQRPEVRVRSEGHADERGSVEHNLALGLRRAEPVRTYLANFSINASRLEVVTFGEEQPIATGTSEEAFARNRRDEFRLLGGLAGGN